MTIRGSSPYRWLSCRCSGMLNKNVVNSDGNVSNSELWDTIVRWGLSTCIHFAVVFFSKLLFFSHCVQVRNAVNFATFCIFRYFDISVRETYVTCCCDEKRISTYVSSVLLVLYVFVLYLTCVSVQHAMHFWFFCSCSVLGFCGGVMS